MNGMVLALANKIKEAGGRAMLVGGCVRDEFLNKPVKDIDIEVYGLEADKLREVLETFGKVDAVGACFAVYKLGQDIDVSLPRREKKVGVGHKGFEVEGDPYMSFEEACSRRDFTINAIMKDPLTGEIVDPLGGTLDLAEKKLRAVSDITFQEDSLRVLRMAQFGSRFQFFFDIETCRMARETDLSDLPKERVWQEIEKLLMKSDEPSVGLIDLAVLLIQPKLFPSLEVYGGRSDAIDWIAKNCNDLDYGEKLSVMVAVMVLESDLKVLDELGLNSVGGYNVRKQVESLVKAWDSYIQCSVRTDYEYHKFSQNVNMNLFSRIMFAVGGEQSGFRFADAIDRLGIRYEKMKPFVTGKDLISHGLPPCETMGAILSKMYDLQMQGLSEEEIHKQSYEEVGAYFNGEW